MGRLRNLFFPLFERMIFELLFEQELPDEFNKVITTSAENVLDGIKGVDSRKLYARRDLCDRLLQLLEQHRTKKDGTAEQQHVLPKGVALDCRISSEEWALFLQGVFFTTGVVQLAEGMTHVWMALAQHPAVLQKVRQECKQPAGSLETCSHFCGAYVC